MCAENYKDLGLVKLGTIYIRIASGMHFLTGLHTIEDVVEHVLINFQVFLLW